MDLTNGTPDQSQLPDQLNQNPLGQQLMNQFQNARQTTAQPQVDTSSPIQQEIQRNQQQLNSLQPTSDRGGPIKKLLFSFLSGAGDAMRKDVGLPTQQDLQQRYTQNLIGLSNAASMEGFRQSEIQRNALMQQGLQQGMMPISQEQATQMGIPWLAGQTWQQGLGIMSKYLPAQLKGQFGLQQQGLKNEGNLDVAQTNAQSKLDQLRQTQAYGTWKTKQDNATKMAVAQLSAGKAPAAMMQSALFAQSGLNRLQDGEAAVNELQQRNVLGSFPANKVEDWLFGQGAVDPSLSPYDKQLIGRARAALSYTSSAAMRAHTGRTSKEIYDDFKNTLGMGQNLDALRGAFQETRSMLGDYAQGATNASINSLRTGTPQNSVQQSTGAKPTSFAEWKKAQGAR